MKIYLKKFFLLLVYLNWHPNEVYTLHIIAIAQKSLLSLTISPHFLFNGCLGETGHLSYRMCHILWIWHHFLKHVMSGYPDFSDAKINKWVQGCQLNLSISLSPNGFGIHWWFFPRRSIISLKVKKWRFFSFYHSFVFINWSTSLNNFFPSVLCLHWRIMA